MLRFEHKIPVVIASGNASDATFKFADLFVVAKVRDPDTAQNCILEFEFLRYPNKDQEFDVLEEAQIQAAIEGRTDFDGHLPTICISALNSFEKTCRIFPVNDVEAEKQLRERVNELDAFSPFSNE